MNVNCQVQQIQKVLTRTLQEICFNTQLQISHRKIHQNVMLNAKIRQVNLFQVMFFFTV